VLLFSCLPLSTVAAFCRRCTWAALPLKGTVEGQTVFCFSSFVFGFFPVFVLFSPSFVFHPFLIGARIFSREREGTTPYDAGWLASKRAQLQCRRSSHSQPRPMCRSYSNKEYLQQQEKWMLQPASQTHSR